MSLYKRNRAWFRDSEFVNASDEKCDKMPDNKTAEGIKAEQFLCNTL
ncbi:MAG: hypothetical protein MRK02_12405 [Candidatus Scalindua sp.]|nr:hypothetical protein [Candidatus Scalindua sp.]